MLSALLFTPTPTPKPDEPEDDVDADEAYDDDPAGRVFGLVGTLVVERAAG